MFTVELLPVRHGDCVWIEYGRHNKPRRILIDGGPITAYTTLESRIAKLPPGDKRFELLIITHVDADHIEGTIRLIAEKASQLKFVEVWFNGWRHLEKIPGQLGPVQGEFVSALIEKKLGTICWNKSFNQGPVVVSDGLSPTDLADGMRLTLLSPSEAKLEKLRKAWKKAIGKKGFTLGDLDEALSLLLTQKRLLPEGLLGGRFQEEDKHFPLDHAVANGSSIAFLAEFEGKRCLFLGDAHPDVLTESIGRLVGAGQRLAVDAVKVSHHGSRGNITPDLLRLLECKRFLISTNGDIFDHPDDGAMEAIIDAAGPGVELYFNYLSDRTRRWSDPALQKSHRFKAFYPSEAHSGITLEL